MERVGSIINRVLDDVANAMEARRKLKSELVDAVDAAVNGESPAERVQRHVDGNQASIEWDFTEKKDAAE